ncbi:retrovirus-related pol polyprotein from transposon TNT 1-94, partial [Tanacetum coccineum]
GMDNGEILLDSIFSGLFPFKEITIPANEETRRAAKKHIQTIVDLTPEEKTRIGYGIKLTKQEKESKLADVFDRFTSEKGETIQLYYLSHNGNEDDASEVQAIRVRFPNPLALVVNTYNSPPSYASHSSQYNQDVLVAPQQEPYLQKQTYEPPNVQGRQTQGYASNTRKGRATGTTVAKTVGDYNANPPKLNSTSIFMTYHANAFDSDCDDVQTAIAIAIFMARLSPIGLVNGDDAGPSYDSDILSEYAEQAYWLPVSKMSVVNIKSVKGVPKQLLKTSKAKLYFNETIDQLDMFDGLIKVKTTINVLNLGPINSYFRNNKLVHKDNLNLTKEHTITLQELLEQTKASRASDKDLEYAFYMGKRTKDETPELIVKFLKQVKVSLKATVRFVRIDNGTEFVNQKAVAIACYTQNQSLIHNRYNKTPYELLRNRKPDLKFLNVFGEPCYPTNNGEDLRKLKPKADIGIFSRYSPEKKAY